MTMVHACTMITATKRFSKQSNDRAIGRVSKEERAIEHIEPAIGRSSGQAIGRSSARAAEHEHGVRLGAVCGCQPKANVFPQNIETNYIHESNHAQPCRWDREPRFYESSLQLAHNFGER